MKRKKFKVEAYNLILDGAAEEIVSYTEGSREYLSWFMSTNPDHAARVDAFLGQCYDAAEVNFPVFAFETLVGVYVAQVKHLYQLWKVRDELPPGVAETMPFVN